LKLGDAGPGFGLIAVFPRSIDRGPIEATVVAFCNCGGAVFPRSIDRGPIEALFNATHVKYDVGFPRSIDRGPIEAPTGRGIRNTRPDVSAVDRPRPN